MGLYKLDIYNKSLELSNEIWEIYKNLSIDLKYNIGSQLLRSIDSIGANIAEGYGRYHYKDSLKFYYNARGSLWESKHWVYLLYKRDLINEEIYYKILNKLDILGKQLNSFINKLRKKNERN